MEVKEVVYDKLCSAPKKRMTLHCCRTSKTDNSESILKIDFSAPGFSLTLMRLTICLEQCNGSWRTSCRPPLHQRQLLCLLPAPPHPAPTQTNWDTSNQVYYTNYPHMHYNNSSIENVLNFHTTILWVPLGKTLNSHLVQWSRSVTSCG